MGVGGGVRIPRVITPSERKADNIETHIDAIRRGGAGLIWPSLIFLGPTPAVGKNPYSRAIRLADSRRQNQIPRPRNPTRSKQRDTYFALGWDMGRAQF